jgi:hypothetical protein
MYVRCPVCGEDHVTETHLEVLGIHEGDQGQDVLEYICPRTGTQTEATVYRGR